MNYGYYHDIIPSVSVVFSKNLSYYYDIIPGASVISSIKLTIIMTDMTQYLVSGLSLT